MDRVIGQLDTLAASLRQLETVVRALIAEPEPETESQLSPEAIQEHVKAFFNAHDGERLDAEDVSVALRLPMGSVIDAMDILADQGRIRLADG